MLSEEDKTKLSEILTMSQEELESGFNTLKEEVNEKLDDMILNESDDTVKNKLNAVLKEAGDRQPTKYNYYKLQQLKNGL